jgi:hypothetical protein
MYIFIAANGELSLQDSDNMRAFSIREGKAGSADGWLAQMATPAEEEEHYWLDADVVLDVSGRHYWLDADVVLDVSGRGDDQQWVEQFWEMLTKVEAYGYSDMTNKRVKAHLDQT